MSELQFHSFPRISFRYIARGGSAREAPQLAPANLLLSRDALLLLVHGYNVEERAAFEAYDAFLNRLGKPWADMAVGVYWPGDSWETVPDGKEGWAYWLTRYASYSWQPKRAREIGRALADRLTRAIANRRAVALARAKMVANSSAGIPAGLGGGIVPAPLIVHIVAHSMGCRLTLELLDKLKANLSLADSAFDPQRLGQAMPVEIKFVALMAPAVFNYLVGRKGEREAALKSAARHRVFRSSRDLVLQGAFPLGQLFESDQPRLPFGQGRSALGATGPLDGERVEDQRIGHGDYWSSKAISQSIAKELEEFHPDLAPIKGPAARRILGRSPPSARVVPGRAPGWRHVS